MPQIIEETRADSCALGECIDALADMRFDPTEVESVAEAAAWLNRLNNNRDFLAEILVERLTAQSAPVLDSGYGPQAVILSPMRGNVFLRANIWPAQRDLCFKTSGAKCFVYGVPHDHNFSFLTSGYCGPGYRSDYFEYEYEDVAGFPGERAALRFIERSALHEGKVMLYRAHRDVHSQLPPESLSVSLNIMHIDPAQCWYDQYGFDLDKLEVTRVLSSNASEAFLRVAVGLGTDEALDCAKWIGQHHPSERLRLASFEARAGLCDNPARDALWREAELSGSLMIEAIARKRRAAMDG